MTLKTFRGLMGHGDMDRIHLKTINGRTGYRIVKFDTIKSTPGAGSDIEGVTKVYTVRQDPTAVDGVVDLSDQTLIAVNYNKMGNVVTDNDDRTIVFDDTIVNQDLYVTFSDITGNQNSMNYYLELEQFKIDSDEATVATLTNMRTTATQTPG